jgi:glucokinase
VIVVVRTALGLDIGGTKLAAAIVSADGTLLSRRQAATPTAGEEALAEAVLRVVAEAIADAGHDPVAVGIGSAGPLDPVAGTISPVNIPACRNYPIVALLARALPDRPVRLAGDAQAMALGEYWHRSRRSRAMLGVVMSTGVGGGIVADGVLQAGPTGNAGHIGHLVIDAQGPSCGCGGRGCVETYASGPSILAWARAHDWHTDLAGDQTRILANRARAGDRVAIGAFTRAADAMALGVLAASALADLDDVVIGGGVANGAHDLLFGRIRSQIGELAGPAFMRRLTIEGSQLGGDAGLVGAGVLALQLVAAQ